jgi:hypothetical protein
MDANNLDLSNSLKIERYKNISQQISTLNANIHKYMAFYHAMSTTLCAAIIYIFINWKKYNIPIESVQVGIRGLYAIILIIAIYVIFSIIAGIFSWIDLRQEEVLLLKSEVGEGFRKSYKLSNIWRWYEPYMIFFIVLCTSIIVFYIECILIPAIV